MADSVTLPMPTSMDMVMLKSAQKTASSDASTSASAIWGWWYIWVADESADAIPISAIRSENVSVTEKALETSLFLTLLVPVLRQLLPQRGSEREGGEDAQRV